MSKKICPTCNNTRIDGHSQQCLACYRGVQALRQAEFQARMPQATPEEALRTDILTHQTKAQERDLKARYKDALERLDQQQKALDALQKLQERPHEPLIIEPKFASSTSEATVITPASDWHLEERVGAEVNGLNTFNLEIAEQRVKEFFSHSLRLVRLLEQDVKIPHWVLPLLGDFITNDIHEAESSELNEIPPIEAILLAQTWIISGLDFLLNNTTQKFTVPCHSGNHARTTKTTRFSAENGHSLEYFMYSNLARHYAGNERITFDLPAGIHSYVNVYGRDIRFHHGHAVKYGGGVGGIYIPVNKAIAQWNKGRQAYLDVFGHFHQQRDGGNFICNGSLIGYNGFAMSIKADFERPRQVLFLEDKKRGRTCVWPILFSV